jgi:hypothetical protein
MVTTTHLDAQTNIKAELILLYYALIFHAENEVFFTK